MNGPLLTPEVESLIQGYVEGELTDVECARLRELLETSPALVNPILTSLQTDALVRQTVLQTAYADSEIMPNRELVSAQSIARPRSKGLRRFAIPFAVAGCLAGLVVLGAVLLGPGKKLFMTKPISPAGSGSILYEYWEGIPGNSVADLTSHPDFQRPAARRELLTRFEAPSNRGENYGARIRGYLHPPVSGDYLFWIASDDAGELWLSDSENPADKRRICFVESWVPLRQWARQPSQQSPPIRLERGRRYYIEALHKQADSGDSLAVAWQPPGGVREIIPGSALTAFSGTHAP
jgi:hypothetical protein